MSQVIVQCSQCGQQYKLAATSAGKRFQCQKCNAMFVANALAAAAPTLTPVAPTALAKPTGADLWASQPSAADPLAAASPLHSVPTKTASSSGGTSKPVLLAAGGAAAVVLVLVVGVVLWSFSGDSAPATTSTPNIAQANQAIPAAAVPSSAPPLAPPPAPGQLPPAPPAATPTSTGALTAAAPAASDLPATPAALTAELAEQLENRAQLIAEVTDISTAKAVSDRYPSVADRVNQIEAALRNRLIPAEEQQQLNDQFKARIDAARSRWAKDFNRVTAIPGVYENMDPELAPHADMTPFPTDLEGLHQEALRTLGNALTAARQVTDFASAQKMSPPFQVANARASASISRLRAELKLGVNGSNPADIVALGKLQDEELKRIGQIPGAHAALLRGESNRPTQVSSTPAAGVQSATLQRPGDAENFFAQNPLGVVVRVVDAQQPTDHERVNQLIMLSTPPLERSHSTGGNQYLAPIPDLEEFLTRLYFVELVVDRTSRVIHVKPRYPLPAVSQVAAERLVGELQSGDQKRVRNALGHLTNIKPGPGREVIGDAVLQLLPLEPVRGQAVDVLKRGWFSHEQIPLVKQALPTIQDEGLRRQMVVGISMLPDLDPDVVQWISSFYPNEHHAVMECWENIGPPAEPFVQEYLKHQQHDKRKDAAKTLGRIGTSASIPLLEKLASDKDGGVRDEAKKAIAEINKPDEQREWFRRQREQRS